MQDHCRLICHLEIFFDLSDFVFLTIQFVVCQMAPKPVPSGAKGVLIKLVISGWRTIWCKKDFMIRMTPSLNLTNKSTAHHQPAGDLHRYSDYLPMATFQCRQMSCDKSLYWFLLLHGSLFSCVGTLNFVKCRTSIVTRTIFAEIAFLSYIFNILGRHHLFCHHLPISKRRYP